MNTFFCLSRIGGIGLFSPLHLMWLISALGLCLWLAMMERRGYPARRGVGLALLISEGLRVSLLFFCGGLDESFLPLHLCSLAVYACIFHAAAGGELAAELIYSTLAPGALIALLFPDWLAYPSGSFIFLSSFGIHSLVCGYWCALVAGGFRPDPKKLPKCLAALLLFAAVVYIINLLLDTNYLFLMSPSPGSPLEWADRVLPWHGLIYIPGIALVWGVLYFHQLRRISLPQKRKKIK